MSYLAMPPAETSAADLQRLVDDGVRESRAIGYRSRLDDDDGDLCELLADVSSFANTAGGQLVVGMKSEDGVPVELVGVEASVLGAARIEHALRDGLDPGIAGLHVQVVALPGNGAAAVIQVARSLAGPHMVTFKGRRGFYARSSIGRHPMDVTELRTAFLESREFVDRARRWRRQRLWRLGAEELPVRASAELPTLALHLVPFSSAAGPRHDMTELSRMLLGPVGASGLGSRYNFDGFFTYDTLDRGIAGAYLQFFSNGCVETVNAHAGGDGSKRLPMLGLEQAVLDATGSYLGALAELGASPPVAIMLTLANVRDYVMAVSEAYPEVQHPIDRESLVVPEVVVSAFGEWRPSVMKPAFDAIWNAAGWPSCPHFDAAGDWDVTAGFA